MSAMLLQDTLLRPSSVAIIGASADPDKTSGRPIRFLKQHGFRSAIWPVNPGRREVLELPAYPSLRALPRTPDQVYIVLDSDVALVACEEAIELGVPVVGMLANGFSEAGPQGVAREEKLRRLVRGSSTRLLGPNSLGIVRPSTGFVCTANAAFAAGEVRAGRISVISQSGSAIGTFVSRGRPRGIGFATLVSVGNEADLSIGEIGNVLVDDEETDTFILFLESFKHTADLERFAKRAADANKAVLVYKLGRSAAGAALAVSHTGALVSSDAAAETYLRDLGFHRFDVFDAVFEGAPMFGRRAKSTQQQGSRVAVVTTTGGGGALVADRLALRGLTLAGASETVRQHAAAAGIVVNSGPLIDLTLAGARPDVIRNILGALLEDPGCDAVAVVIGSSAEHFPELTVKPILDVLATRDRHLKPVAVFTVPHAERALALLGEGNIGTFRTPEACADAIATRLQPLKARFDRTRAFRPAPRLRDALRALPRSIGEYEATSIFTLAGVPSPRRCLVGPGQDPQPLLASFTYPVVVKVASADLPHKSEYGGVRLNVGSAAEIRDAIAEIRAALAGHAPTARIDGFLVQEQRAGVQEVILGLQRDSAVGALITLGVGGIFTELYADVTTRRAPVDTGEAAAMIDAVRGLAVARGYRGRPKGDLAALAQAISAFSQLGAYAEVEEAEINPLIVGREGEGVWAVDGLLSLRKTNRSQASEALTGVSQ
jgi:acyl-CoA synthetase (NDP forming)